MAGPLNLYIAAMAQAIASSEISNPIPTTTKVGMEERRAQSSEYNSAPELHPMEATLMGPRRGLSLNNDTSWLSWGRFRRNRV